MIERHDIDILINTARLGDATSQHAFELARALLAAGGDARIVANRTIGPLPADLRDRIAQIHPADYLPTRSVTIVEYPLWHPLAEAIREAPGARIFWYQGVTDPALWSDRAGIEILRNARARTTLAWRAHLAVTGSPFTAAELHRFSHLPPTRIHIMPLGVDLQTFADPRWETEAVALRKGLHLGDARVLLFVGNCAEHKRIDLMIDALALLGRDYELTDIQLLIVGDTSSTTEARTLCARLRQQAAALDVADRVTFTGRVDAVEPYYQLADLYLQASQHEGFCVPLVEAMAADTPVVASVSGSIPWVLGSTDGPGEANADEPPGGLLFTPGDGGELAATIRRLLGNPDLYAQMQSRGRTRALMFSLERFRQNTVEVVNRALDIARQGPPELADQADPLHTTADVIPRDYRVRSNAPVVGPLIERTRVNATSHLKEAYLDPMFEQQVNYNRQLAEQVILLRRRIAALYAELDVLSSPPG